MPEKFGVLVDLSGTLYIDDTPIQGAVKAVQKLHQMSNVKTLFVTNTTRQSSSVLNQRLTDMLDVEIDRSEIFSALSATRQILSDRNLKPTLLLEDNVLEEFETLQFTEDSKEVVVIGRFGSYVVCVKGIGRREAGGGKKEANQKIGRGVPKASAVKYVKHVHNSLAA